MGDDFHGRCDPDAWTGKPWRILTATLLSSSPLTTIFIRQMAPAVAIAVFNQLEELNSVIGSFFTYNDAAAQTLPNWMQVQEFLQVNNQLAPN